MSIKGIDISAWQDGISFDKIVDAGVDYIIIRAGYAKTKDRKLDDFVRECESRSIKYGFYWYSYALTVERAEEEATACIECIKQYKPDYPVYFDMEDKSQIDGLSKRTRTDMAIAFCEKIKEAGFKCGIYANPSWLESYYIKSELVGKYDLWLACWTESPDKPTKYDYGQTMWQWGLDKIGGYNVDGDLSYKDYSAQDSTADTDTATQKEICIGDIVMFSGGWHYVSSTAATPTGNVRTSGKAEVMNIAKSAPRKYALRGINGGSDVYGWVDNELVSALGKELAIGDKVKVKAGAKTYKGGRLADFVYTTTYVVMQIGSGVAPDYIVIGDGKDVTAAIKASELLKV